MAGHLKLEDLQSFEELFAPKGENEALPREQRRRNDRKAMDVPGFITIDGRLSDMRTVDLSLGGLSLRSQGLLAVGKEAHLTFMLDEKHTVAATVRIVYCFFTHDEDFRAGVEFLAITAGKEAFMQWLQA